MLKPLFAPLLPGATTWDRLLASAGAVLGVALTGLLSHWLVPGAPLPLIVAPVGASAVLLFAVPASPLAQPWPIVGGNTVSALVGILVAHLVPQTWAAAGLAVGLAIAAMSLLRCLHPPGGAAALTGVIGGQAVASAGFSFAADPVLLNSVLLVVLGCLFHRTGRHSYPHRPPAPAATPEPLATTFTAADVDRALEDMHEGFDIDRADLEALLRRVEAHAAERRQPR